MGGEDSSMTGSPQEEDTKVINLKKQNKMLWLYIWPISTGYLIQEIPLYQGKEVSVQINGQLVVVAPKAGWKRVWYWVWTQ